MKQNWRARFLVASIAWMLSRPYTLLGTAFVLTVASVLATVWTLDFHTGQHDLISPRDPLIQLT